MIKNAVKKSAGSTSKPKRKTKAPIVEALLEREDGVSLGAIGKTTGWKNHSSRAFLTGLRKKGREVVRHKDAKGNSIYKLTPLDAGGIKA